MSPLDPADAEAPLERSLNRIERRDAELHAFLHHDAAAVRQAAGESKAGPLANIPVAVKDNIVTLGTPTTCGSRMLETFRSPFDATVVARLRAAGAVVVGKTNLDEFAMGSSTEHSAFGVTRNPWDLSRVAGGSSGGSAAAVAAGMASVALGSETGGSVRQPAAFCGVLGFKPTYGRISRSGLVAFASSLDQVGIFSTTAEEAARTFGVVAGHDPADSTTSAEPVGDPTAAIGQGIRGLRFAFIREMVEPLQGDVRDNFARSVDFLRSAGAVVEEVSIESVRYAIAIYYIVANAEASANLARFDGVRYGRRSPGSNSLRALYTRSREEGFGAEVKRRIMLGTFALSSGYYEAYYGRAQAVRSLMRREMMAALSNYDILLSATTPSPAFRIGEKAGDPLAMYLSDIFTAPANLVGIPAVAIPSGLSADGLPLSLQMMARPFDEARLFGAAAFFEQSPGWREVSEARERLA
jgi:aspartyl-tRNA(Asn)/glutamyl-tRNA(Gln) amidotransferase subunit A